MAATNCFRKSFAKRLLSTAIATAPAMGMANSAAPHQQWNCQPDADNNWQCQQHPMAAGSQPERLTPQAPATGDKKQAAKSAAKRYNYQQWDWVSKEQLADPSVCKTGCQGSYIAPKADWEDADQQPETSPLRADAANSSIVDDTVMLQGDVVLSQGHRSVKANSAQFNRRNNQLQLSGNITAREPNLLLRADRAELNTESNLGRFDNALFLTHDSGMRGTASTLTRSSETTLELRKGQVTQCTPDDELWSIRAGAIHLDTEIGEGTAKHARLNIKNVPVLYFPYFSFPIDDRRKTGFLVPSLGSGKDNGFELTAPYYLNLAANFDATVAPHYIKKRGTMIEAEARWLNPFGQWLVAGSQLDDDQYTETPAMGQENEIPPQENRWSTQVKHQGKLLGLSTRIDYSKVSDVDFFDDLATDSLELKRTTHLNQQATIGYVSNNWELELTAQDHQTVDELLNDQYQLMPRLSLERRFTGASFQPDWQLAAEFTDFQHDQSINDGGNFVTGERSFVEAGLSYPMRGAGGFFIPTAQIRSINYQLDEVNSGDDDSPSATAPLATLDMGLIFERPLQFANSGYMQTLEPRLYYLYSEYQQQDEAPVFDSRELRFSYSQLFRDSRFSGHDRLDDADQLSVGLSSRFINDSSGREVLTLSLGQIFYFEDRQVQINDSDVTRRQASSNIATEVLYQPGDRLWLSNNLLWDSREDKLDEGGMSLHYQSDANNLYNLGYRFRRDGTNVLRGGTRDLSQADASMALALNDRWSLFSRYRYDVEQHRSVDQLVGIQYEDCCWMLRLIYQQGLKDEFIDELTNQPIVENDYAFILEFQLKGLGSLGNKAESLLNDSILGYEDLD